MTLILAVALAFFGGIIVGREWEHRRRTRWEETKAWTAFLGALKRSVRR